MNFIVSESEPLSEPSVTSPSRSRSRRQLQNEAAAQKAEKRRGVDIEVKVATRKPSLHLNILKELEQELRNMSLKHEHDHVDCPDCEGAYAASRLQRPQFPMVPIRPIKKFKMKPSFIRRPAKPLNMRPAYECDEWEPRGRTCWLDRNIGDTVTFVLAFSEQVVEPQVQWRQEFHMFHSKKRRSFPIDPANPLWNIVIGSRGHELRLSPVTEMDIDDNSFSAMVIDRSRSPTVFRVSFRIRVMPLDMGFVYPGETLIMNMRRVSLPPSSMIFQWYFESEGPSGTLPSNMKLSPSGAVLTVSELRKEQEGIMTCAVFTNKGFFATKQRFNIKEMNQSSNMLLFEPNRPSQRRRRQLDDSSDDYIDEAIEENQKMSNILQDIDKSNPNHKHYGNPYAIENIDVYRDRGGSSMGHREPPHRQYGPPRPRVNPYNRGPGQIHGENLDVDNIVLEIAQKPVVPEIHAQDILAKMISWCNNSSQCATDADCVLKDSPLSHFCRCRPGFQGSGIFCWEDLKVRSLVLLQEQLAGTTEHMKIAEMLETMPQEIVSF